MDEADKIDEADLAEDRPMGLMDPDLAPGLARLAFGAWWRTGIWTAEVDLPRLQAARAGCNIG